MPQYTALEHARRALHFTAWEVYEPTDCELERAALAFASAFVRASDDNPDLSRGGSVAAFLEALRPAAAVPPSAYPPGTPYLGGGGDTPTPTAPNPYDPAPGTRPIGSTP